MLGPLVVERADGSVVSVGGWARRLLFGALLSRAGRTVSPDVLIDDVWGVAPPRSAAKTLQSHVVRLRHDLGRSESETVLVSERTGYRLVLGPDDFDVTQFERRVSDALAAQAAGELQRALAGLDDALVLWRGEAYEEFADAPYSVGERLRLFELRADALEHRTDIALALGQTGELVPDLEKRVTSAPYRERGWEQLIIALYRAGRQADALGAYRRASATLAEDLGIDPGPSLRELEAGILRQDRDLLGPLPPRAPALIAPRRDVCPYRGLASYTDVDSELFVGRERLTAELVGRLADSRLVVVAGASGTGKSSVLRAGLVAALRAGALPGSASWRSAVVTPTDDLTDLLTAELDLVVFDQAEELFTRLTIVERRAVVDRLEEFVAAGGRAVLSLRGDFYGRLAELQGLARHAEAGTVLVGPLREDELRRVVVEPAHRVGLQVEEALVDTVLDDVAGQPGALPMLSVALVRTWENRVGDGLTLDGYQRGGGVASAVEATAEAVYLRLDEAECAHARQLLVRLAGREGDAWIRRPTRRADVSPDAASVLTAFAAARLVTITDARVEITHDALLAHWPRLREWLEERVLAAALLDHLEVATHAWQDAAKPSTDLYRGARLQAALEWRAGHPDDVSSAEGEFLDASEAAADAELTAVRDQVEREARGRRRLRAVAIGLAATVVLAAGGVVGALQERASADRSAGQAESAALTADSRRLAALSLAAPDIATSSLLAVASYRLQDSMDSRGALLSAVERNQSALWRFQTDHRPQRVLATPDGTRLAVLDNRRNVHIIDPATRQQVGLFSAHADWISAITPDGRQIVTYGPDHTEDSIGRLSIVDVATGRRVRVLTTAGDLDHELEPALSTDGRWLVQVTSQKLAGGVAVDVFDTQDWAAPPRQFAVPQGAEAVAAGRSTFAIGEADGSVEVRRWVDLRPIAHLPHLLPPGADGEQLFAMTADGSQVAVVDVSDPGRIDIVRVSGAGAARTQIPAQAVGTFGFSPDGAELAVTGLGGSVAVYTSDNGTQVESLAGHAGPSYGLAWTGTTTPTGLYTVGLDSNLVSWSIGSNPRFVTESGPDIATPDRGETFGHFVLGLTPYQGTVPESTVSLYRADLSSGTWAMWSPKLTDDQYINQFVGSADGKLGLLSVNDGAWHNQIQIWDLVRHVRVGELDLPTHSGPPVQLDLSAAISPDGRTAYCTLDARRIGVFALPSGRYLRSFSVSFAPPDGDRIFVDPWRFDPDGRLLIAGIDTGPHAQNGPDAVGPNDTSPPNQRLLLFDPHTERTLSQIGLGDIQAPTVTEWSQDGRYLAVGTVAGTLTLYEAGSLRVVASAGAVEPGSVRTAMFSPDGRTLVTSGSAGTISFWDVPSLQRVAAPFSVHAADLSGGVLAFYAPNSDVVGFAADVSKPTSGQRWFTLSATPAELVRTACGLAGADITQAQWQRDVGDRPYQHVCT